MHPLGVQLAQADGVPGGFCHKLLSGLPLYWRWRSSPIGPPGSGEQERFASAHWGRLCDEGGGMCGRSVAHRLHLPRPKPELDQPVFSLHSRPRGQVHLVPSPSNAVFSCPVRARELLRVERHGELGREAYQRDGADEGKVDGERVHVRMSLCVGAAQGLQLCHYA